MKLKQILTELSDIFNYTKKWVITGGRYSDLRVPKSFTLHLKKEGYEAWGKIWRGVAFVLPKNIDINNQSAIHDFVWEKSRKDYISFSLDKNIAKDFADEIGDSDAMVDAPFEEGDHIMTGIIVQKSPYIDIFHFVRDQIPKDPRFKKVLPYTNREKEVLAMIKKDFKFEIIDTIPKIDPWTNPI